MKTKEAEKKKGITATTTSRQKTSIDKEVAMKYPNNLEGKQVIRIDKRTLVYAKTKEKCDHIAKLLTQERNT